MTGKSTDEKASDEAKAADPKIEALAKEVEEKRKA